MTTLYRFTSLEMEEGDLSSILAMVANVNSLFIPLSMTILSDKVKWLDIMIPFCQTDIDL